MLRKGTSDASKADEIRVLSKAGSSNRDLVGVQTRRRDPSLGVKRRSWHMVEQLAPTESGHSTNTLRFVAVSGKDPQQLRWT